MEIGSDILYIKNIIYNGNTKQFNCNKNNSLLVKKYFKKNYNFNNKNYNKIIEEPVIIIDALHNCYSHTIMDNIFPIYWIMQDIKKQFPNFINFKLFIKHPLYSKYYTIIDNKKGCYINIYNELIKLITPYKSIFQHLVNNNEIIFIKHCFIYDTYEEWICKWQRCIWNCSKYYPQRLYDIKNVKYDDTIIYKKLNNFIIYIKNKYNIKIKEKNSNLIIIDRKKNRFFDKKKLNDIIDNIKLNKNIKFNGIKILDEMDFKSQLELFSNNSIFIFRHGSCLTNLLWIPEKSIIFDLDIQTDRNNISKRLCKVTNSIHYYLNYNNFNPKNMISLLNNKSTSKIYKLKSIPSNYGNKLITLNNIDKLNLFNNYKIARIFGKGPTFKNIKKTNKNQLHICINQATNEVSCCDMIVLNDLHNIDKINKKIIENAKFILIPEFIHVNRQFSIDGHWLKVYEKINNFFYGHYIIYNLISTEYKNPNIFTIETGISSSNTTNEFVCSILNKYINKVEFYGIGITSEKYYHDKFIGNGIYTPCRTNLIKNNLIKICNKYKKEYSIN